MITVSVVHSLSSRRREQVRPSNAVDAQIERTDSTWEKRIARSNDGRARAGRAFSRNHETDENPSTVSECGVSATTPWRANVRANASVMAPSSQPLSPISKQAVIERRELNDDDNGEATARHERSAA